MSAFIPVDARDACTLANLAYDAVRAGHQNPQGSVCVGNFAYVARRRADGSLCIAFQGTNDLQDALCDLRGSFSVPDGFLGCPAIHPGFWAAVRTLLPSLLKTLDKASPVVLTGHSLGAGLAVLAAAYLRSLGYDIRAVYGFGCPRVGGIGFANHYSDLGLPEKTSLFIHGRDWIPNLPWWGVPVAPEIFLDLKGHILAERMSFEWWLPWRWGAESPFAKDHDEDQYQVCMDKLAAT